MNVKFGSKIKILIASAIGILISLFMMFGLTSNAGSLTDLDKEAFNVNWDYGEAKHWTYHTRRRVLGINTNNYITYNFIRIEDKNGNLVDSSKITRLAAKYEIDGEAYTYCNEIDNKDIVVLFGQEYLKWNDLYEADKEGVLIFDDSEDIAEGKPMNSDKSVSKLYDNYEDCNLIWLWCLNKLYVTDIMELYVWYETDEVDENNVSVIEATSFVNDGTYNGLHPMYDDNGEFIGVYDAEGNLADGYSVNEIGMICNASGIEIDLSKEQTQGTLENVPKSIISIGKDDEDNVFDNVKMMFFTTIGVVLVVSIIYGFGKVVDLFKRK